MEYLSSEKEGVDRVLVRCLEDRESMAVKLFYWYGSRSQPQKEKNNVVFMDQTIFMRPFAQGSYRFG
jgi:hypothetical protein